VKAKQNGWEVPVYTIKAESDMAFERQADDPRKPRPLPFRLRLAQHPQHLHGASKRPPP
jgi:hypothetical protein